MRSTRQRISYLFCLAVVFSSVSSSVVEGMASNQSRCWEQNSTYNVSAAVVCLEQQPSISLTSHHRGLVQSPKGAVITRGHSFTVTCSINSNYTSGRFFLIFSGNIIVSKPAVNNSASFSFSEADYEHQGNYSCMYEATESGKSFNSTEATPISVIVEDDMYLLIYLVSAGILLPLLLLILLVICLVRRRKSEEPGSVVLTQMTNRYEDDDDEEEEEEDKDEGDYVNVDPGDADTKRTSSEDTEDDYINTKDMSVTVTDNEVEETDDGDTSDDEDDYVNVPKPVLEQVVDIYGEQEDVYQNF